MMVNWQTALSRIPLALAVGLVVTSVVLSLMKVVQVQVCEFAFGTGMFVISLLAFWGVGDSSRRRDLR